MGYVDAFDILTALGGLEMALADLGYSVTLGAGVQAAEQLLRQ
jgi:aspartate aminotransferase-like enzyme